MSHNCSTRETNNQNNNESFLRTEYVSNYKGTLSIKLEKVSLRHSL